MSSCLVVNAITSSRIVVSRQGS